MSGFTQRITGPRVRTLAFDLRSHQRRAMHFRRYAQHQLAASRFLRVARSFFAGVQAVGHSFLKSGAKRGHVVRMKTNDVCDAGNTTNKAGIVIAVAVADLSCVTFELHGGHSV